jgi:Flp pilus assembly protein TadG
MRSDRQSNRQRGATIIEFALGLLVFLTFILGITDFGRMLYTWNAANEAARSGARYAVVCDNTTNTDEVLARMQQLVPEITSISTTWTPSGCGPTTCEGVTVSITGLNFQWISPIAGVASTGVIPMPSFSTFLTREVMRQDPNSATICS